MEDFATPNYLQIELTMFDHENNWIFIDVRPGSDIIDVSSIQGMDADSDHFLVKMKVLTRIFCQKCVRCIKIP